MFYLITFNSIANIRSYILLTKKKLLSLQTWKQQIKAQTRVLAFPKIISKCNIKERKEMKLSLVKQQ